VPLAPRADLALVPGYHSPQVDVPVRLNTNESPYPPPEAWRSALADEVRGIDWHRYPDRSARDLRAAIGERHGVGPEQVLAANGSNEVLQTLCLTFGGAGRTAVTFEPTYALHGHIARLTGTAVVAAERGAGFVLDPAEVSGVVAAARPDLVFLCSPNNPTGTVDDPSVAAAARDAGAGLVVVDEAYGEFAPRSLVADVAAGAELVVTRTFSKTWSMAGGRLGYCVAPAPVVAELERVVLPYHLDVLKQAAGRLALRHADDMAARVAALVAERRRLAAALDRLAVEHWPSGANFVLFRPLDRDGGEVWQALLDRGVLVRNCATWPRLAGCLRVTVGTPEEGDAFLAALEEVLSR
jgi:histidinol-phosphate aminotransferase